MLCGGGGVSAAALAYTGRNVLASAVVAFVLIIAGGMILT